MKISGLDGLKTFYRDSGLYSISNKIDPSTVEDVIKDSILENTQKGIFFGGEWAPLPYSEAPTKAYKFGWATVTGSYKQRNQELSIDGIHIERDDWFWGGRKEDEQGSASIHNAYKPFSNIPTPVLIGGYEMWRNKYNSRQTAIVDLNYTGKLLDSIFVVGDTRTGSNQYRTIYSFSVFVDIPYAQYVDEKRTFTHIDEESVAQMFEDEVENSIRKRT